MADNTTRQQIIVGVDGSASALQAARWAGDEAARRRSAGAGRARGVDARAGLRRRMSAHGTDSPRSWKRRAASGSPTPRPPSGQATPTWRSTPTWRRVAR